MGDPRGIGPEIVHKSVQECTPRYPILVVGSIDHYRHPAKDLEIIKNIEAIHCRGTYFYHIDEDKTVGDISFEYVKKGAEFCLDKRAAALVTAPISKKKWHTAGIEYKGHTDFLARYSGVSRYIMFFWSDHLKVALYTQHIPLREVFGSIRKEKIIPFVRFLEAELLRWFGRRFALYVSGLNPHGGEQGTLGDEEINEIIPALNRLRSEGEIDIRGPFPPDTVFLEAQGEKDAVVVCWYHDQGLIPFKLKNIHEGVNVTLGLPFIRTSPDHGTAYDIAGKGIANPSSMTRAIKLAEQLLK